MHQPFPTLPFTFSCMAAPALSDMTNCSARLAETGGESSEEAASVCVQAAGTGSRLLEGRWGQIDVIMWPLKNLISNPDV